jgi:hypothetical protein
MADRKAKPGTTIYLLRDIDRDLWRRARSRALLEGKTIRQVILDLLDAWAYDSGGFVEARRSRKGTRRK